jgi:hypothetical protein
MLAALTTLESFMITSYVDGRIAGKGDKIIYTAGQYRRFRIKIRYRDGKLLISRR